MSLPVPSRIAEHFESPPPAASRSLWLARGVDSWDLTGGVPELDKGKLLRDFVASYRQGNPDFTSWSERRKKTWKDLDARCLKLTSEERLVVGLGLPHPTETGFLLDRLTGCPYLPGSTVKGLLRATAREVTSEDWEVDLGDDGKFWQDELETVFGRASEGDETLASRGTCVFFDAYPEVWPKLELDILTPHYSTYYRAGDEGDRSPTTYPGDWENPGPVTFLTVAAGTPFCFPIRYLGPTDARDEILGQIERLLTLGLTWLGVGGKTQAGYGFFAEAEPKDASAASRPEPPEEEVWEDAYVTRVASTGELKATHLRRDAFAEPELTETMPDRFLKKLKRGGQRVTVTVREDASSGAIEILKIDVPERFKD